MKKGIIFMLLSSLCFAIVNVFVKELSQIGIPSHELVFFRCIISLTISSVVVFKNKIPYFGNNKKWLFIRGLFGSTALFMFFITVRELPLAIATSTQYLSPVFTILFAIFINKQRVVPRQWIFIALSFIGVLLFKFASGDSGTPFNPAYILLGMASALLSGIAYNAVIKCKDTDAPITIVMYFPLVATPIMATFCLFEWQTPVGIQWLYVLIMGIFTQFAQILMTKSLHSEDASIITPFKYVGAIYAVLTGWIFFGEGLSWWTFFGILLIISGVILNSLFRYRRQKSVS